jgi:ribosome-binding factor A
MAGKRCERIARVIREEASRVVLYELGDPRIGFVTVTRVKVSADLSHARVYVSVYGDDEARERTMQALIRAAKVVKRACGPRLKTRIMPQIEFEFDPSVAGAIRIRQLIEEARASDPDSTLRSSSLRSTSGGTGEGAVDGAGEENIESGGEVKDDRVESAERDDGVKDGVEKGVASARPDIQGPGE